MTSIEAKAELTRLDESRTDEKLRQAIAAADADADARDMCSECGHSRDSHKEQYGGICIGCPCTGWKESHREE